MDNYFGQFLPPVKAQQPLSSLGQPFPDRQDVNGNLLSYLGQFPAPVDKGSTLSRLGSALATTWPAQMAKSAFNAATLPGDVYAGRVDPNSEEALGRSVDLAGLATLGSGAFPAAKGAGTELRAGIKAYHGSPHDFDRFDLSRIGTGEGAQAYGHGLYFAGNETVARGYRDALTPNADPRIAGKPINDYYSGLQSTVDRMPIKQAEEGYNRLGLLEDLINGGDVRHVRELAKDGAYDPKAVAWFEKEIAPQFTRDGRMYEVNINADPAKMLDWDAPVPMGNPLRERVAELGMQGSGAMNAADRNMAKDAFLASRNENMTGSGLYNSLSRSLEANRDALKPQFGEDALFAKSTELARRDLLERGIPGIKYLDAGSRAAGDGSRNYVVFDDNLIDIMRKYGVGSLAALPASVLAGMGLTPDQAQAADSQR